MCLLSRILNAMACLTFFERLEQLWLLSRLALIFIPVQGALGVFFIPVAYALGVPYKDCQLVASTIAIKTVVNEFVAYKSLDESWHLLEVHLPFGCPYA